MFFKNIIYKLNNTTHFFMFAIKIQFRKKLIRNFIEIIEIKWNLLLFIYLNKEYCNYFEVI